MTEYDYSPEAWERYLATQARIARWVDGTLMQPPCNAFSPATPHLQALALQKEQKERDRPSKSSSRDKDRSYRKDSVEPSDDGYEHSRSSSSRHRKAHSTSHTSSQPHHRSSNRDHDRRRDADRDQADSSRGSHRDSERSARHREKTPKYEKYDKKDLDYVFVEYATPTESTEKPTRPRAQSYSANKTRPPHSSRSHTTPNLTLDLPPFPNSAPPVQDSYYHNRYSGHSSHSSNTTRPSSGSTTHGMFPSHQLPPYSAPAVTGQAAFFAGNAPKPLRSQTMPMHYGYPAYQQVTDKYGYPMQAPGPQPVVVPLRNTPAGMKTGYPAQYPHDPSAVPPQPWPTQSPSKQQSLLKRMFTGLTGRFPNQTSSSSQPTSPTKPHKDRPEKEGTMFLGGGGKKMTRKRSVSF